MSLSAPSIAIGYSAPRPRNSAWCLSAKRLASSLDDRVEREGLLDQRRQLDEARHEAALALGIGAVMLGERHHQHAERGELRGEGLGGGDADLRARARQHDELATRAPASSPARCRWRASRDSRTACARRSAASVSAVSPDCEMVTNSEFGGTSGIAVAVLAGDVDGARQLADLLDEVARHDAGVEARAAGDDVHVLRCA